MEDEYPIPQSLPFGEYNNLGYNLGTGVSIPQMQILLNSLIANLRINFTDPHNKPIQIFTILVILYQR